MAYLKPPFCKFHCSEWSTLLATAIWHKHTNTRASCCVSSFTNSVRIPVWQHAGQILSGHLKFYFITHIHTHPHTPLPSIVGMCTSDFAALCWVMPRPVPKIAALLLIPYACPLAIGWYFGQPGRRHNGETTFRLCLRSNAILIFLRDGKLEDMVTSRWQGWAWRESAWLSVWEIV